MVQKQLCISLLGKFKVETGKQRPSPSLRRKTRALLAYLAATRQTHTRQTLMDLFCQNTQAPPRALSLLLSRIRRQLGAAVLIADNHTVQLSPRAAKTDYAIFQQQLSGDLSQKTAAELETAVALYRGEFLEGLTLPKAPEFELWLLGQRAHTRQLLERGLLALAQRLSRDGGYNTAIRYTRQLLQHNPLLEEAHARLIWLYARTGQRNAALNQYEQCRALLQTELGIEPTDELQRLQAAVAAGQLVRPFHQETIISPAPPPPSPDFVGRAAEIAQLQTAWRSAQAGQGRVIIIGAMAGGGKTRLVKELMRHLPETAVYAGQCCESARALPYQPWLELLEAHWQRLDGTACQQLPPATLGYISRLLPGMTLRLPPAAAAASVIDEPQRLFTAVADFLAHSPTEQPAPRLLFLDDLQWADETSLRLLHYLSQRIRRFPWLLIGAYRTEEAGDALPLTTLLDDFARRDIPRLTLSPLTPDDIETLTAHIWPRLAPGYRGHIAAMIARATGGNALFVAAVLQELAASNHIPDKLPVPSTVQELIQRRLRRLPQGSRQALEALAALGSGARLTQLQQISARSGEETAQALEWGLQWGLVTADAPAPDEVETAVSPAAYQFHHDLIREAVYATLSPVRKQRLHRRIAVWLARIVQRQSESRQQEMAGRILYHAQQGEAFDLVFHWAPLAAAHARQLFAYRDALRALDAMRDAFDHLQFAPDFDPNTAEPLLFEQMLWWLRYNAGVGRSVEEEQAVLQQARALLNRHPSPLRTAQFQFIEAISYTHEETISAMQDIHLQFLRLGDLSLAALALSSAASASITLSRNKDGRSLYEQALSLYRQAHDAAGEVNCLAGLAWTAVNLGEIAIALRHSQQALAISRTQGDKLGEAAALFGLTAAWAFYCVPDKMEALAAASMQLYEQIGFRGQAIRPYLYLGSVHILRGEWEEALAVYADVLAQATALQDMWTAGWAAQLIGRIYLCRGQLDAAAEKLQQARQIRLTSGERQNQVSDLAWLGRLALANGDTSAALSHTAQAIAQLDAFHGEFYVWEQPDVLMCRAEALAAAGEMAAAHEMARRAQAALHQFAQQIDDPDVLAQFMAYPLYARVETAVATQQIPRLPACKQFLV